MDLSTYNGLQDAIADYVARDDLEDQIPGFIQLAEVKFARLLCTVDMESAPTVLTTAADGTAALPVDFVEARSAMTLGASGRSLTFRSPEEVLVKNGHGVGGTPYGYTTIGGTFYLLPAGISPVTLVYQAKFIPLSDDTPSNWLLASHPDIYLYGALAETKRYTLDQADDWSNLCGAAIQDLQNADLRRRWGRGRMRPAGRLP